MPRPSATVMLVRGGQAPLEVLMVKRGPQARVMADAWVFPGGTVDSSDGDGREALAQAARRELLEETGIALAAEHGLFPLARWITPPQVRYRYDTWFFVATAPENVAAVVDGSEIVDHRWIAPKVALAARDRGELTLVFPTVKQLQQLARFATVSALLDHASRTEVVAIQPHMILDGDEVRILLPGEPGYQE